MRSLQSFIKKEYLESARNGRIVILAILFLMFGIVNPAIAKLTPWLMEMMSDAMAESGLAVANARVDAMTSWTQFFKNIPVALIAFVLIFSDVFTKEYRSGTLLLLLTKGLSRYKVVLAKTALLLSLWTIGYGLCFAVTYGCNAYYWDNAIAANLFAAAAIWWLFGVWVICLLVLFSSLLKNNALVILRTGVTVLLSYLLSIIPKVKPFSPAMLINASPLLYGVEGAGAYCKAVVVVAVLCAACVAISIPIMNRKQL